MIGESLFYEFPHQFKFFVICSFHADFLRENKENQNIDTDLVQILITNKHDNGFIFVVVARFSIAS